MALAFFAFAAVSGLFAQDLAEPTGPTQKIGTITIKFVGVANVSEQVVRANMALREGNDFDEALIDRDIRSLYKTNLFEFIEVKRENVPPNTVNLVVEATPKYRILAIKFKGNKQVKEHRLQKEIKSSRNGALDERQVKDDSQKLTEYYQKTGYNQVQIAYTIDRNKSTGFGTITFEIREGNRVKISSIKFIGNDHIKTKRLKHQMDTATWHMFSWLTGGGRLKNDEFEDDLVKLRDYYKDWGYLDVEIAEDKVTFDYPTPNKLNITIRVNEGRLYHIGDIAFSGNKLYQDNALRFLLRQKTGMVFRPSKLDKDVEGLTDLYGRDGHLETQVHLIRKPNLQTGNIDLEYKIEEGDKYQVETVKIEGNTKTKSTVILRELILGPGDSFDSVRMKISKARLENTRFFDDVNVTDESTNIPGRRNMKVAVKEARTGNLTFGAGYSSLERATVFAELSQSNFDVFNRKSFFQGAGQKFKLRLQIGSLSNEILLSFEEPWFMERELALGFQLFRTLSDYNSADYQEVRIGGTIYARKRLFGIIEGTLSYTYETVDITDVNPSSDPVILALAGYTKISKVGLTLVKDTRNKIINTSRGSRMSLDTEVAGGPFLGDVNYYKLDFHGSTFLPLFKTQNQVLSLIGRAGVIESFGKSNEPVYNALTGLTEAPGVPFFDRFFLGGPDDLRGFEFRDVGPKDASGEPIGGKSYAFFNAEYTMDIVKPIRFAIFYDIGYVNASAYDFNPRNYNDDFGVGIRLMVAGAPLSLDYGIPLTGDHFNRKGNQFNFSFGTRF
ncbi:MAG TPA: outer membrane protein assembly factor BamA [Candidatus Didemnitutus sp.]|nr:outer membrane protein assembly factor BamA [Candidatus Didemnitutus sp.]